MSPKPAALSPVLAMPLADARHEFDRLDNLWHLVPAEARQQMNTAWTTLVATAADASIHDLRQVLTELAPILRAIAGSGTALKDTKDETALAAIHLHRNVAITIGAAAAASVGADLASVYARPTQIELPARTLDLRHEKRPLEDDEIVLIRTHIALATGNRSCRVRRAAGTLAMADAGLTLRETTQLTIDDLMDVHHGLAEAVLAHGHRNGLASRFIPLDQFHALVLRTVLEGRGPHQPLLYEPRKYGDFSAAGSAATSVVNHALEAVGLRYADIDAASLRRWRVRNTWHTYGQEAAAELAGTDITRAAKLAGITVTHASVADHPEASNGFTPLSFAA